MEQFLASIEPYVPHLVGFALWLLMNLIYRLTHHPSLSKREAWLLNIALGIVSVVVSRGGRGVFGPFKPPFWIEPLEKKEPEVKPPYTIFVLILSMCLVSCGGIGQQLHVLNESARALTKAAIPIWNKSCEHKSSECNKVAKTWLSKCKIDGFYYSEQKCFSISSDDPCKNPTLETKVVADSIKCVSMAKSFASTCPSMLSCQRNRGSFYDAVNGVHILCASGAAAVALENEVEAKAKLKKVKSFLKNATQLVDDAGYLKKLR